MATTLPIEAQNIEAYDNNGNMLGYVIKVSGTGTTVTCRLVDWKCKFPKKRAKTVMSAAKNAIVCLTPDGTKHYMKKENITFKMVEA